jgi:hypothetical protein
VKEISLEVLTNSKKHAFFYVLSKNKLVIKTIKAKFVFSESKYVYGYCKIIWNRNPKCNSHIQIHFKVTHRW